MTNPYLTHEWLSQARKRVQGDDQVLANMIASRSKDESFQTLLARANRDFPDDPTRFTKVLNHKVYGDINGPPQPEQQPEQEQGWLGWGAGQLARGVEYATSPFRVIPGAIETGIEKVTGTDVFSRNPTSQAAKFDQTLEDSKTAAPLVLGAATGFGAASLGASALRTGFGAAVGQSYKESVEAAQGEEQGIVSQAKNVLGVGATSGLTDLAFGKALQVAGKAVKSLYSPLASQFDEEIATLAKKHGMTLPVSSMSDSPVVQQAETLAQKGIFGGKVKEVLDEANDKLLNMGEDLVKKLGGSDDLTIAGKSVQEGADAYRSAWRATKNKLYEKADNLMNSVPAQKFIEKGATFEDGTLNIGKVSSRMGQPIDFSNTKATLDPLLANDKAASQMIGNYATSGILGTLRSSLDEPQTIQSVSATLDKLNQMASWSDNTLVSTGDKAALKKVILSLDRDLERAVRVISPELADALDQADAFYKQGIELLDSKFGDRIAKLADEPTKIVDALIGKNDVDNIPRIFELIGQGEKGAERVKNVQSAFARKIVSQATKGDNISGTAMEGAINKYGESTVRAVLGDDAVQALREISKLGKAIQKGQVVAKGSPTTHTAKLTAFITSIATGNLPLAAAIAGGDSLLVKLFGTQWFRQWVTKGFGQMPMGKQVAGRMVGAGVQKAATAATTGVASSLTQE